MSNGRQWELALEAQHLAYRQQGRAVVHKTEPRRDKRGRYVEKAPPDFVGCIAPNGRAVVFDAKDCDNPQRWPLSGLQRHQAADLEAHWKAGAISFVALRFRGVGRVLDWGWLRRHYEAWRMGRGRASVPAEEIERCPEMGGEWGADWLG